MERLPEHFLFRLLEQNPITELFRAHTKVIRHDRFYACCCPFHSETAYSCKIYPDLHIFYCPVCQAGGDAITFIMRKYQLSYYDAVDMLAQNAGLTIPSDHPERFSMTRQQRERCYEINRETANFYYQYLLRGADKRGLQYFAGRQLLPQTVRKYGLGFAPDNWNQLHDYLTRRGYSEEELLLANVCRKSEKGNVYDNFRNRVMFPIVSLGGNVIGFGGRVLDDSKPKYLNTSDTPVFDKGSNLFSLHFARKCAPASMILAEGYMDVIAIHQAGFQNVVATLGTAITAEQARLLAQYASEVIIAYDSDNAGQNATQKALKQFQAVGLPARVLHMEDAKDPDEFIRKFGAAAFRRLLEQAGSAVQFQLDRCRNGLDLQTENGRATLLRRSVQVLADISRPHVREQYIHDMAKELEIRPEILTQQVERLHDKHTRETGKSEFRTIRNKQYQTDSVNPMAVRNRNASESEKTILAYLLRYPEEYRNLSGKLLPDDFVTDFHRKMYALLWQVIPECKKFIPSLLGEFLSPEEMGHVAGILDCFRDIRVDDTVLLDCIRNLQAEKNKVSIVSDMTDNDLTRLIDNKKRKTNLNWNH